MSATHNIDKLDRAILRRLQANGRETYDVIGEQVGLSPSAVLRRVKRLEETGVIKGFTNGSNASIHHVAGSNQVGPGLRLHHRLFAQLVDGFIVQDDAFWAHNPVVAITGVRIEGHVGHDRHLGDIPLELTNRPGDQTVGIETF